MTKLLSSSQFWSDGTACRLYLCVLFVGELTEFFGTARRCCLLFPGGLNSSYLVGFCKFSDWAKFFESQSEFFKFLETIFGLGKSMIAFSMG